MKEEGFASGSDLERVTLLIAVGVRVVLCSLSPRSSAETVDSDPHVYASSFTHIPSPSVRLQRVDPLRGGYFFFHARSNDQHPMRLLFDV